MKTPRRAGQRAGIFPALLLCLSALPGPAMAEPRLAMPVDCTLGDTCFIQNYMDRDPGPGAQDFTCAGLSYDTHKGTDFALPTLSDMARGVTVRAAADGVVTGARDGMIDRRYTGAEDARIDGRDCGNGVVLLHADGWETQYCHLKQGSVLVRNGQMVRSGDALGQIGLSGRTQFPHLHISVRRDGAPVDPFTPDGDPGTCRGGDARTLWIDDITYQPGGVVAAGFSVDVPSYDAIKAGTPNVTPLPGDAPAIVLWGYAFGGRQADVLQLTITGPEGRVFNTRQLIKKDQAQFFRAGGKRLKAPLPVGDYTGTITLIRDKQIVSQRQVMTRVE